MLDENGNGIPNVPVVVRNLDTKVDITRETDDNGNFSDPFIKSGNYRVIVEQPNYERYAEIYTINITETTQTIPPISLKRIQVAAAPTQTPEVPPAPGVTPTPVSSPTPTTAIPDEDEGETLLDANIQSEINRIDARRGGGYQEKEVSTLPLGAVTLIRTFDELALLLPGVAPPPPTLGDVAGPGVGAGVGSAGQFSVNGLRSRGNNFTVDGSDNNDEDIGVRRQGFLALVPQPIESIQEYRVITLLAPAQYGRNFGAQVNAVSKSGGNDFHGTFFGFLNSSQLNSRNFFDTTSGNAASSLRVGNQSVITATGFRDDLNEFDQLIPIDSRPIMIRNESGGEDSFTLGQGGFVLGGPIVKSNSNGRGVFFFVSTERQVLNATKEASFAVPTVAQRGFGGTGASGIFTTPLLDFSGNFNVGAPNFFFPTTGDADAIFSLFPFPNNPNGVYRENTFTQTLPASGEGTII
ncbi:MAG: carboxypeptidase regulatory-like domain-containing protein, partial [Pyrinomonadaceae bacterium]